MAGESRPIWAALSDESLELRLRHYYWLTTTDPHLHIGRYAVLVEEAHKRGKPEMVERAKDWVKMHGQSSPPE